MGAMKGGGGGYMMKGAKAPAGPEPWELEAQKYPGLLEAMKETIAPVAHLEEKWSEQEIVQKMVVYVTKAADTFAKDDRLSKRGSPVQAQAVVEEFVETAMASICQGCQERAWVTTATFANPLCLVADQIFKNAKLFARMLAPMLHKYVEDAIFRFREEQRITNAIWETVENSGLSDKYYKKCNQHLNKVYDDCHISSQFGASLAVTPELGLLQDFVKGWMSDFVGRAWDVLENGVGARDEQVNFVINLFQTLCHPDRCCLPHDLTAGLGELQPPASWPFIAETAMMVFAELDNPAPKKQKKWGGFQQQQAW
jgi:hypothetical protein